MWLSFYCVVLVCKHVCQCMCPMPVWEQRKMSRSSTFFCLSLWDGVSPWTWTDCFVEAASSKHLQSSCLCTEDAGTSATLNIFYVGAGIWTQILLLVQLVLLPTEPHPQHPGLKHKCFCYWEDVLLSSTALSLCHHPWQLLCEVARFACNAFSVSTFVSTQKFSNVE